MTLFKKLNEEYNILVKSLKLKKREIKKLERQLEDILEKMEDENETARGFIPNFKPHAV